MASFPILNCDTPFTISIDAQTTSTGISAYDRALTVNTLATGTATLQDFKVPGHIFPLIANDHLLKAREGHTEATVTLMKLAGLPDTGVCCEIMGPDGNMISGTSIHEFADTHHLNVVSIDEIKDYYYYSQILVNVVSQTDHKLVVNDPYSKIDYYLERFNCQHADPSGCCYEVLVMNQYRDLNQNLIQAHEVASRLLHSNFPTVVIDLAHTDMTQS